MGRCSSCCGVFVVLVAVIVGLLVSGLARDSGALAFLVETYPPNGRLIGVLPAFTRPGDIHFTLDQLPDLTGHVSLVTGANIGLGRATTHHLALNGATVVMGCRNPAKCERAKAEILQLTGIPAERLIPLQIDLAKLKSVVSFAAEFKKRFDRLDELVLNAGVGLHPFALSEDGIERTFAINHVGHFLLFRELRALLELTAERHSQARVVVVSSASHFNTHARGVFTTLKEINDEASFVMIRAYGQSKLANVLFAQEAAAQLAHTNVLVNSCHPGVVATAIAHHIPSTLATKYGAWAGSAAWSMIRFVESFLWTSEQGASTQLYLAASPEVLEQNLRGKYFHPVARQIKPHQAFANSALQRAVWHFTEELLRLKGV